MILIATFHHIFCLSKTKMQQIVAIVFKSFLLKDGIHNPWICQLYDKIIKLQYFLLKDRANM